MSCKACNVAIFIINPYLISMRKLNTLLSLLLCLGAVSAYGKHITPDEALSRMNARSSAEKAPASYRLSYTDTDADGKAAIYVFTDNADRRIFLSADDQTEALLGYIDSPVNGEMPPQLRRWLDGYIKQIEAVRKDTAVQHKAINPTTEIVREAIASMITSRWGQGAPYNAQCPNVDGRLALTGCGATALAQVMNYFEWPERATGTGICYDYNNNSYSMDLGSVSLDWKNMADIYDSNSTQEQKDAVAQLMKVCGYAVGMTYSPSWSNSQTTKISEALRKNFNYAPTTRCCQLLHYSLREWEDMLYENLSTTGPIIYRGNSIIDGGHIFVCDGYSRDGFFHFNWGWNGNYDGYFRLSALNPYASYTGIEDGGFSEGQWAILGIHRPDEGSIAPEPEMTQENRLSIACEGSNVAIYGGWYNYSSDNIDVELGIRVEHYGDVADTEPIYCQTGAREYGLAVNYGWSAISVNLDALELTDGMYKLTPVYRNPDGGTWRIPLHPVNYAEYAVVQKKDGEYSEYYIAPDMISVTGMDVPQSIYNGRTSKLKIYFVNKSSLPLIAYYDTRLIFNQSNLLSRSDGFMLSLEPGETVTKEVYVTHTWNKPQADGSYELYLADITSAYYMATKSVNVADDPGEGILSCNSFTIEGGTENVDPDNLSFKAGITCESGYYDLPVTVNIYRREGDILNYMMSARSSLNLLKAGEASDINIITQLTDECRTEPELYAILFEHNNDGGKELGRLRFTIGSSGVENVEADTDFTVTYDSRTRLVTAYSPAGMASIAVLGIDGRTMTSFTDAMYGDTAILNISDLPAGIYMAVACDCDGRTQSVKIIR